MPRTGTNADVQWLEIDPCYVFHPVNAHEEDGRIILHVSRMESAFGDGSNDYAEVGRLTRWTIDPVRGTVDEQLIDGAIAAAGRNDSAGASQAWRDAATIRGFFASSAIGSLFDANRH